MRAWEFPPNQAAPFKGLGGGAQALPRTRARASATADPVARLLR